MRPRLALTLVACALFTTGCDRIQSPLAPASPPSQDIATLWWWMLVASATVFAGSMGMIGLAWLRRNREGMPLLKTSKARMFGLCIAFGIGIPIVVNVVLFVVANFFIIKETAAPAAATTKLTVHVVGRQWFWEVRYPGSQAVTANEIHIPVRTRVNLVATTGDVIHSFWVPQLNRKIDMIPGRNNRILLYADKPGRYRGQCAEFCGLQHAHMAMWVVAQTPQAYRRWLALQASPARNPTTAQQQAGQKAFFSDQCASCHSIRGTQARGQVGPDLTHVGSRTTLAALVLPNTPRAMARWIPHPQEIKPGNRMPDLGVSRTDVRHIVSYLESLK